MLSAILTLSGNSAVAPLMLITINNSMHKVASLLKSKLNSILYCQSTKVLTSDLKWTGDCPVFFMDFLTLWNCLDSAKSLLTGNRIKLCNMTIELLMQQSSECE